MTINERIKFAEEQREESFSNGSLYDLSYWVGYIDALKAALEENERLRDSSIDYRNIPYIEAKAKADTVRKLAERIKDKSSHICTVNGVEEVVDVWWIDKIAKEMLEGAK